MVIWHICATSGDLCNGMVAVIPGHVKAQSEFAKIVLINLGKYKYELTGDLISYAVEEMSEKKYEEIIEKSGRPDLVVFHGIYLPKLWSFYLRFVKNRYKYIVIPHGSMSRVAQRKSFFKKLVMNHVMVYSFTKKSSAVQFLSEAEASEADRRFYERKIIIGNGIEKKEQKNTYENRPIKITYIGRIDNFHKGLDILVHACKKINVFLRDKNVEVNIFGNNYGDSKKNIEKYVRENHIDDIVKIFGPILGDDKKRVLLQETSYFIMPSRYEGQPMAALEALSYGIPVIMSVNTGFAEEIKKFGCGYYTEVDADSVAQAMKRACLSIESHAEMSEKSLECVEKYYWENIGKATYKVYSCLVRGIDINGTI